MYIQKKRMRINNCNNGGSLAVGSAQFQDHVRVWVHHAESQLVCFYFPDDFSHLFISQIGSITLEVGCDELSNFLGQVRHAAMKTSSILLLLIKLINDLSIICQNGGGNRQYIFFPPQILNLILVFSIEPTLTLFFTLYSFFVQKSSTIEQIKLHLSPCLN